MKKLFEWLNRVSVCEVESVTNEKLILKSKPRKIMNPLFIIGSIGFVVSSFLRGFLNWHIGEILLAVFTLTLVSGVWYLSAAGKVIFNKTEGKIFRVYRHLGYLQKVYSYSLASIDNVLHENRNNNNLIFLLKDDRNKIWISDEKNNSNTLAEKIREFLNFK